MTDSTQNAPEPNDPEFMDKQNTVELQADGVNADEAGTEPGHLPDEPPLMGEETKDAGNGGNTFASE